MPKLKTASTRRAKRRDKLARWVITLGGITVIASVVAILALIVGVALPLFRTPHANVICTSSLPASLRAPTEGRSGKGTVLQIGIESNIDGSDVTGFVWFENGIVAWIDMRNGGLLGQERLFPPDIKPRPVVAPSTRDAKITLRQVEPLGAGKYSLSWSNGAASLVEIVTQRANRKDVHTARYAIRTLASISTPSIDIKPRPVVAPLVASQDATAGRVFIRRSDAGAITRAARLSDGTIAILRQVAAETPMGDEEVKSYQSVLREDIIPRIRTMAMDREGNTLYAGTEDGRLVRWQLDEQGKVAQREVVRAFADGRTITALALVLGDVSLAMGDAKGELAIWTPVNTDGTAKLRAIHQLQPHQSPIQQILPSGRNKSILSLSEDGIVHLDHMTSERHLLSIAICGGGGGGVP